MNIVFGIRGEKYLQQMIVDSLNNLHFYHTKKKGGKTKLDPITHCLQPITFYSMAVPQEYSSQVFTSLGFEQPLRYNNTLKNKMALTAMRKAMGLKPIPKFEPVNQEHKLPLNYDVLKFMHIFPIGIKKDVIAVDEEGYEKEMI